MTVQPGLCGTWSETLKNGFLTTRLIYEQANQSLDCYNITNKFPEFSDTHNICCNFSMPGSKMFYHEVMLPNGAHMTENSVGPNHTDPRGLLHC